MAKPRGTEHTSLTETATLVVREIKKIGAYKMIAPGEIRVTQRGKGGKRHLTCVFTKPGCELIITGQSVQKVAVHTDDAAALWQELQTTKALREFSFSERLRQPGI